MRFGFVTCVELGFSCIKAIYDSGYKLDLVITLNDNKAIKKSGRIYLDHFCKVNNINLVKCDHINDIHLLEVVNSNKIDWLFIIGWSQIAGKKIIRAPKYGVLGMHPTLLPQGRGRASIPWAILKNLRKTGVTLFKIDEGVDTGKIGAQLEIDIEQDETSSSLYEKIKNAHYKLMIKSVYLLVENKMTFINQDKTKSSTWPGRKPSDGQINLDGSVFDAERMVRALTTPYPGAFVFINGVKIIIWKAIITNNKFKGLYLIFHDGILGLEKYDIL